MSQAARHRHRSRKLRALAGLLPFGLAAFSGPAQAVPPVLRGQGQGTQLLVEAGIESIWEGRFVGARWVPGRLLNGDESHQGRHLRIPPDDFGIQRLKLYRYR